MGSNLRRRGGVWWFRRRVPDGLHARLGLAEISRSLRTSSFMTARARAKRLWLSTDSLFVEMSNNPSLTEKQAKLILDQLAGEPLFASPTADDLVASVVQGDGSLASLLFNRTALDLAFSLPDEQRQVIAGHLARITDRMEAGVARLGQTVASERAGLAGHIASRERKRADEAEAALRQSKMAAAVQAEVNARLTELAAARPAPPASAPVIPAPARPSGPSSVATGVPQIQSDIAADDRGDTAALEARRESRAADAGTEAEPHRLSGFVERFFRAKQYRGDVEQQSRTTIRMWIEVNGDMAPRRYTEEHAFAFQDALRQLPSSHGKGGHVPVRKAIEKAKVRPEKPRLKEKTIERHFSTMKQFWEHIGKRSADQSIFDGSQHKVIESQRWPWTEDALDKLLRARWNPSCRPANRISEETHAWLVAIGGYIGARVEEIARLRVIDIEDIDGVPCFIIRAQVTAASAAPVRSADQWMTKTVSGERAVPVHPRLIDAGLLDLVARRREQGADRLFDLNASGPKGFLAVEYSREFSRHKIDLGIPEDIVFHSFRHNVETLLGSKPLKQEWIDVMMGHKFEKKGQARKSIGVLIYLHGLEMAVLQQTAYAVEYPAHLCPTLLLRRLRGEVPWE
jgi:integrase